MHRILTSVGALAALKNLELSALAEKPRPAAPAASPVPRDPDGVVRVRLKPDVAPSEQLKEAKQSRPSLVYLPHQGRKEILRRRKQAERAAAKASGAR